ncbi:hypothetical protein LADH09A_003409 [Micromonospora sp. LAH09]|uniref:hypothetical protein n=1 Tax=Micromonospora cabrerizensis TaxID=2911213 RepID=UPI001EE84164|nr:hypothetical protein [Micromonospora cabrerizensis]MCG5469494.1 hypothetical protein [Micromonospora cabrerizensis]
MIQWHRIPEDPRRFERVIQAMIREDEPGAEAIDGSGGDGGQDSRTWRTADGRKIFEIKSMAGRLTNSHKRQIGKSLKVARKHDPDLWILVIPLNPSPSELSWFDRLREDFAPIVLEWRGIDWLDGQFERRQHLRRALEGESGHLLELARQYKHEQEVLAGGLRDYAGRLAALTALGDTLSLHWVADPARTPEGLVFSFRERYPGAAKEHPFAYEPTFAFPSDDPEAQHFEMQWWQVKNYGGKATIPGRYVENLNINLPEEEQRALGFDRPQDTHALEIRTRENGEGLPLACTLELRARSGSRVAVVPFQFTNRVSGARGVTLSGQDAGGFLSVRLIHDNIDGSCNFTFNFASPFGSLPCDLRPTAELMLALAEGREIEFKRGRSTFAKATVPGALSSYEQKLARLIIALDDVQEYFEQEWPLPEGLTGNDLRELEALGALVRDGHAEWPYKTIRMSFRADALEEVVRSNFFNASGAVVGRFGSFAMVFAGHRFDLGPVQFYGGKMELTNRGDISAAVGSGSDADGKWKCVDGAVIQVQTITANELEAEAPVLPMGMEAAGQIYVAPAGSPSP